MQIHANNPANHESEASQLAASKADDALDSIALLPEGLMNAIKRVAEHHGIKLDAKALEDTKGYLEDTIGDLFDAEQARLMEISGWRKDKESTVQEMRSVSDAVADVFSSLVNTKGFGNDVSGGDHA